MGIDLSKLDAAFKQIDKEVGKDVGIDLENYDRIPRIKSESPLLNYITNGGYPRGQIIEIFGPESSGKSLISQQIAASYQKEGEFVSYIDLEFSFEPDFARSLGLDLSKEKFKLYQPSTAEEAFTIAESLSRAGVGIIVFDSVVGMVPSAEVEAGYGDQQMGLHARTMGKGLRKLAPILKKNDTTAIFVNQIRSGLGMYTSPEQTPGGRALKFYASLRLRVKKKEFLQKGGQEPYGILSEIEAKKSKIGPPLRKGELTILFESGIDTTGEYIDFAIKYDIIKKGGSWFTLPDKNETRLQGKDNVRQYYLKNPEEFEPVKKEVDKFFEFLSHTNVDEDNKEEVIEQTEEVLVEEE